MNRNPLVMTALLGILIPFIAGCSGSGAAGGSRPIVVGTTDGILLTRENPAPLDPATSYDVASWNVLSNTFQMLLGYQHGSTVPTPDAASECHYTTASNLTYQCTLRSGLAFSNGDRMTSADVKFSFDRMRRINSPVGPASLLSDVRAVSTPDARTVSIRLDNPDATFAAKLTTPAAAILDHAVYPAARPYAGLKLIGSGPYVLDSLVPGKQAELSRNTRYKGIQKLNNNKVELRMFSDSRKMESALKSGAIDTMSQELAPAQLQELEAGTDPNIKLVDTPGGEARYLFLNTASTDLKSTAVRQAIAMIIDRQAITRDVYQRTADPLYSVVPQGFSAHVNSFFDRYGNPDVGAARKKIRNAGFRTRIPLTINYRRDTTGTMNRPEAAALARQLNASGLFSATTHGEEWHAFLKSASAGRYQAFTLSWLPDFPDPDNYITPFFGKDNFLKLPYENRPIQDTILPAAHAETGRAEASSLLESAEKIITRDVPLVPLWQAKRYIISRSDITGTEWALNSVSNIRFWELGRE